MNKKFDPVILINEEDISCKVVKFVKIMIWNKLLIPTNFVPAVAVKRRGWVLLIKTGRKGHVGGLLCGNKSLKNNFI